MGEPDFLAQLVEVMAKARYEQDGGTLWDSLKESTREQWREQERAILSAALSASLTEPCPTCGGSGETVTESLDPRKMDPYTIDVEPCPACGGSGRVPSSARLAIVEQMMFLNTATGETSPICDMLGEPIYRVITKGAE